MKIMLSPQHIKEQLYQYPTNKNHIHTRKQFKNYPDH